MDTSEKIVESGRLAKRHTIDDGVAGALQRHADRVQEDKCKERLTRRQLHEPVHNAYGEKMRRT